MKKEKIILRELCRIFLIVASPIYFPLWVICVKDEGWSEIMYYWTSVFKKDLNSSYFQEIKFPPKNKNTQ